MGMEGPFGVGISECRCCWLDKHSGKLLHPTDMGGCKTSETEAWGHAPHMQRQHMFLSSMQGPLELPAVGTAIPLLAHGLWWLQHQRQPPQPDELQGASSAPGARINTVSPDRPDRIHVPPAHRRGKGAHTLSSNWQPSPGALPASSAKQLVPVNHTNNSAWDRAIGKSSDGDLKEGAGPGWSHALVCNGQGGSCVISQRKATDLCVLKAAAVAVRVSGHPWSLSQARSSTLPDLAAQAHFLSSMRQGHGGC